MLDGATSHLTAYPCKSTSPSEVISKLHEWMDTFQMDPETICADMAFHHPHDMQKFYRMHNVKRLPTGPHAHFLAKSSSCSNVQKVFPSTRGYSFQKSGPDYSVIDHNCPVNAKCSDGGKHTGNSEWQNAYGVSHEKETKLSHGPSFHESRTADIHTNPTGLFQ